MIKVVTKSTLNKICNINEFLYINNIDSLIVRLIKEQLIAHKWMNDLARKNFFFFLLNASCTLMLMEFSHLLK